MGFVIEYHHDGDIRIGDVKNIIKRIDFYKQTIEENILLTYKYHN